MATNSTCENCELEIFSLIWLDGSIDTPENFTIQTNLRQLTDQLKTFTNCEECQAYIEALSIDKQIVLIVSGSADRTIVPKIHEIEQILLIYVYCLDRNLNLLWAKNYSKIRQVITIEKDLIKHIRDDYKFEFSSINQTSLYLNIYENQLDHLLIDYLLKLKIHSTINLQFYDIYQTDHVKEFQETYSSETCLYWLTKDEFLSEFLSQSLQTKNIDGLYLIRFFLRDIHETLDNYQCSTSIKVYHSHFIDNNLICQLQQSINKRISIDQFLITIYQRNRALLDLNQSNDNHQSKILFEINANPSQNNLKPFANITSLSSIKKTSQIVFMIGSIFRITNFFQENDIWICQLDLCNDDIDQIKQEIGDPDTDSLAFGNLLAHLKLYTDAEKYYQLLLNNLSTDHSNTFLCYKNLGNIAYLKQDYNQSLEYHLKSLEIQKDILPLNHSIIADSYNCLGIVYFHQQTFSQAIDSYEKSLQILKMNINENHMKIIFCLNNLALVYRTQKNYSKGLEIYEQIFNLQKQYLNSSEHKDFGETYHNLGAFHWCLGLFDKAMKFYNLALQNKTNHLHSNDQSLAMTLENLGLLYENKSNYPQACDYYQQAKDIYQQTQINLEQIENNILRVSNHF